MTVRRSRISSEMRAVRDALIELALMSRKRVMTIFDRVGNTYMNDGVKRRMKVVNGRILLLRTGKLAPAKLDLYVNRQWLDDLGIPHFYVTAKQGGFDHTKWQACETDDVFPNWMIHCISDQLHAAGLMHFKSFGTINTAQHLVDAFVFFNESDAVLGAVIMQESISREQLET